MTEPLVELEESEWDGRLSYSSFSLYMGCNRKYYLKKVARVAPDVDAEVDTVQFKFGKALHWILETVQHKTGDVTKRKIDEACDQFGLTKEDHGPHLFALLRHYKKLQQQNGLIPTHYELEILTPTYKGYVDVILKDSDGPGWWVGDLKTGSTYSPFLNARLHMDWQLNLYSKHLDEIAAATGYKPEDFKGCRYLLLQKSKLKRKETDNFMSYAERLLKATAGYDIAIPKEELSPDGIYSVFKLAKVEIDALHKMKPALAMKRALPNFTCCTSYFKSCEFWAQCHGKTFTELKERTVIVSEG